MITVKPLDASNVALFNRCDGSFSVDSKLVLYAGNGRIDYSVVAIVPFEKQYDTNEIDVSMWLTQNDRAIFLAYLDEQLAGQIAVRENWNRLAYVQDFVVDRQCRRRGIRRALMEEAVCWAKERGLAGVMIETQDNNVSACRFYQEYGFRLGGWDRDLYRGLKADTDECALLWYLLFASPGIV